MKALATGRITIVDRDGFTRQIKIATIPDGVVVGTMIHAEGTVDADGVTLDATSVRTAPPGPEGRGGPDGPGRPRPPARDDNRNAPAAPAPGSSGVPAAPVPTASDGSSSGS